MSHHHDHHHDDHDHHHHHHEHHHHHHDDAGSLTDADKLAKLLEHWIGHNGDHVANYRDWSRRAAAMGQQEAAELLEEAAEATTSVSRIFEKALAAIDGK